MFNIEIILLKFITYLKLYKNIFAKSMKQTIYNISINITKNKKGSEEPFLKICFYYVLLSSTNVAITSSTLYLSTSTISNLTPRYV